MLWLLLLLAVGLVVVGSVAVIRTLKLTSLQAKAVPQPEVAIDVPAVAERLAEAVRFRTVSHQDPALIDAGQFHGLRQFLQQAFPRVHGALKQEIVSEHSLLYTWEGRDNGLKPILLMGHTDVVPVEPGTEGDWSYPAFEGCIAENFIWGRGVLDYKDAVMGTLEAVEWLLGEGFEPQSTVYLAFGHDEETGGRRGAAKIAELLNGRGVQLDYVLDEGLAVTEGIMASVPRPVALVGIAEKGYTSLELAVQSEGGHSSMPPAHTAVGVLSTAIHKLERAPMPARLSEPTLQMFRFLAPEMPFVMRAAFANLWLTEPLVKRQLATMPATNAVVRTTTAATMFEAGVKDNILPDRARAVVNFRILMGDDVDGVIDHVRRAIGDERVVISPLIEFGSEPSAVSATDSISFQALHQTICQVFPGVLVAPGLVLAATDSRHYAGLTNNIYRFSPIRVGPCDLDRIHGTDERISVDDYGRAVRFYVQLIRNTTAA